MTSSIRSTTRAYANPGPIECRARPRRPKPVMFARLSRCACHSGATILVRSRNMYSRELKLNWKAAEVGNRAAVLHFNGKCELSDV